MSRLRRAAQAAAADVFAKVDDPRLEEYRLAESLDLIPFYRELDGEIGPTVQLSTAARWSCSAPTTTWA